MSKFVKLRPSVYTFTLEAATEQYLKNVLLPTRPEAQVAIWPLTDATGTTAVDAGPYGVHGKYMNGTLRQYFINGAKVWGAPGATAGVNVYSDGLKARFPKSTGTLFCYAIPSSKQVYEDLNEKKLARFWFGTGNDVSIGIVGKYALLIYYGGGVEWRRRVTLADTDLTGAFSAAISWDVTAQEITYYIDGAPVETRTLTTALSGTLAASAACLGTSSTTMAAGTVWNGGAGFVGLWNARLTDSEIAHLAKKTVEGPATFSDGFSIVVCPDPQDLNTYFPNEFADQVQWAIDNRENYNIRTLVVNGDLVGTASEAKQWANAKAALDLLDATTLPHSIGIGNHDYNNEITKDSTTFNTNFPQSHYTALAWWNGAFSAENQSENHYYTFTVDGKDFLMLHLEDAPTTSTLSWANEVLTAHAGKHALVFTHSYLERDGTVLPERQYLWDNLLKLHDNIIFLHCGHWYRCIRRVDNNVHGKPIHQIMANYQSGIDTYWGGGYLRLITFRPTAGQIVVQTYSPNRLRLLRDADNQFTLTYQDD